MNTGSATGSGPRRERWLVLTQYYPPENGAAAVRVRHLVRQLVRQGREVEVVTALPSHPTGTVFPAYRGKRCRRETIDGVSVRRTWIHAATGRSAAARLWSYLSFAVSAAPAVLLAPRPDVLFLESRPFLGFAALLMKWLRGVPYVYNVADLHLGLAIGVGILDGRGPRRAALGLEDFFLRRAFRVSTVSRRFIEHIAGRGIPRSRITFLPNGADTAFFQPRPPAPELRERWALGDRKVFLYAGTFAYYHGLGTLVAAAARLRARRDIAFLLCGDGPERVRIERMARDERLANVIFARAPYEETARLYSIAYASVATLKDMEVAKGMRLAKIFPSLSCAVPVIHAGHGEGADLLREHECGWVTAPEDPDRLAAAVRGLADDPAARDRMGRAGRRLMEREYDWAPIVAAWLDEVRGGQAHGGAG